MQSYCHFCLQNTSLSTFLPLFHAAGVGQVVNASPLSMGLLRGSGGQPWHPASPELLQSSKDAAAAVAKLGSTLEDVALGFGLTSAAMDASAGRDTPTVVGLSSPEEVHATMRIYSDLYLHKEARKGRAPGTGLSDASKHQLELEKVVFDIFQKSNTFNWTWGVGI